MPRQAVRNPSLEPLCNTEAEQAVLGAVFLRNEALDDVADLLRPSDFYSPAHQALFQTALSLRMERKPVDLVTVAEELAAHKNLALVGGAGYLAELAGSVISSTNAAHYARIVREMAARRELEQVGAAIASSARDRAEPIESLIQDVTKALASVADGSTRTRSSTVGDVLHQVMPAIERRMAAPNAVQGVPSGFMDLDHILGGFQPSDLVILAARPSMGKTALAINAAIRASARHGHPVAFFSLEMSKEQIITRALCSMAHVNSHLVRSGHLSGEQYAALCAAANDIHKAPLVIDDTPAITLLELATKCRRIKRESGLDMVVVDYLQLMRPGIKLERREQEIAYLSAGLKALARELDIPVMALSQLNREVEKRTKQRPNLSDLRESGAIEQDADVVAFLYNESFYKNGGKHSETSTTEVLFSKHRKGATGSVSLTFFAPYTAFENQAHEVEAR